MKIPQRAKRVFKGVIFDVYQWEQQLYDGSSATFEALKRPATVQIIATRNGKILLSFEEQPMKPRRYTFLGGRQEEGEDPLTTAKRELLEEAGMETDDWELYKIYDSEGKIEWQIYLFIARDCRFVSQPKLDSGEKIEIREVTFEEFLDIVGDESFWGRTVSNDIFRVKYDDKKLRKLKRMIFPHKKPSQYNST